MSNTFKVKGSDGAALDLASPHSDGHWISDRVSRIVEIIRDLDPHINVQWIPPDKRGANDPVFRLVDENPNGQHYVMFYVQSEAEFDYRVVERILTIDQAHNPLSLTAIDAHNDAVKLVQEKEIMDKRAEAHDLAVSIWKSPKTQYKHDGITYE